MSCPPLIGWVLAEIAPSSNQRTDTLAREVCSRIARSPAFQIRVQESHRSTSSRPQQGGAQIEKRSTIRFRSADAVSHAWTPTDGDRYGPTFTRTGSPLDPAIMYLTNVRREMVGVSSFYWLADLASNEPTRRSV